MKWLSLLLFAVLFGCAPSLQTTPFTYQGESANITKPVNSNLETRQLVILPEPQSDLFSMDVLKRLAKRNPIYVVSYLSPEDVNRQMQIDNLNNRINFYSEILNLLAVTQEDSFVVIAEATVESAD